MNTFTALLHRERWEHPAIWFIPAVFAVLLVLGSVFGVVSLWQFEVDPDDVRFGLEQLFELDAADRRNVVSAMLIALAVPFNGFLVGIMFFYALDSLYTDRRDRSILFWKSLPVSDVETVMSKLATATVTAPALTLAVVMAFQLLALVFAAGVALWSGTDGWYLAFDPLAVLQAWGTLAWLLLAQSLVLLPIVAWLMLASAWAGKAPFLWAVVPPVFVMFAEGLARDFDGRTVLGEWLSERFTHGLPLALNVDHDGGIRVGNDGVIEATGGIEVQFELLWSGFLWSGVAIAAVLLAATIWLRRYRAEPE